MSFFSTNASSSLQSKSASAPITPSTSRKTPMPLTSLVRESRYSSSADVKANEKEYVKIDSNIDPQPMEIDQPCADSKLLVVSPWKRPLTTVGFDSSKLLGSFVKNSLASMYGRKPVPFRLPISVSVSTNSSGILSAVLPVDVTTATEWTNLAALFDEYKVVGGLLKYQVCTQGSAALSQTPDFMHVIGYDPIEGTPLTSTRSGCELQQHSLSGGVAANGASNPATVAFSKDGLHRFEFKVPQGDALNVNSGVVVTTTGWYSTLSSSNVIYWGYLKNYLVTGSATVNTPLVGILYLDVLVRCRT